MSRTVDVTIDRTTSAQHALITEKQARDAGLTRAEIDSRLERGIWVRVAKGVYRLAGAPVTWRQSVLAAVLVAGPDAAASHVTAALLWGLPGFRQYPVHVLRPRGRSRVARAGTLHETTTLPESHIRVLDGIPVTSPERTAFELCGMFAGRRARRAEVAVANLLRKKMTTLGRLGVVLSEAGQRGRRGTQLLRSIVAKLDDGEPIAESELEELVRTVLREAGLPMPRRQATVGGTNAPIGRIDFLFAGARLVIEADSRAHHGEWIDREADAVRDLKLTAAGFGIIRVTWRVLVDQPELFIDALRAQLAARAA